MTTDIYLHVEIREKVEGVDPLDATQEFDDCNPWSDTPFLIEWLSIPRDLQLKLQGVGGGTRGIPNNLAWNTFSSYYMMIMEKWKKSLAGCVSRNNAKSFIHSGASTFKRRDLAMWCSNPDIYNPNWCTASEMEDCINSCFDKQNSDWSVLPWFGLSAMMKEMESSGKYVCRAVFWFMD